MTGVSYDIGDLMREAFGIKGNLAAYKIPERKESGGVKFGYSNLEVIDAIAEPDRMSYLNTPILFSMTFKGGKYNTFDFDGNVVLDDYADFELPVVSLASFRRSKIISKTKALAANGTVKETYGFSDWSVDIIGLCLIDPAQPQKLITANDQKLMLARYEQAVDSIRVKGALFNDLNIYNLVIEELRFSQLKGKPGAIPFSMRCVSDEPLELNL